MKGRTKLIAVVASTALLVVCAAGVAFAADGAVPGDTLYGLDRAAESIGIGNGGLQERLCEATDLAADGQCERALTHAAEALVCECGAGAVPGSADAALIAAANAVATANQGESDQIRARVAEMLRWMASTEAGAEDFGQGVATRARALAGDPDAGAPGSPQNQNGAGAQNGEAEQNQAGDCDQTGDSQQNQNGQTDDTQTNVGEQSGTATQNQNGDCDQTQAQDRDQTQAQDRDQTQAQDRDQTQDGTCDQDQDGTCDQDQTQTQTQTSRPADAGKR